MAKSKMGRPTREEALTKAISAFGTDGIPFELVDPRKILAAIAADPNSSESGKIRACLALMSPDVVDYTLRRRQEERDRRDQEAAEERRRADGGSA